MTLSEFFKSATPDERHRLAAACETSSEYLRHCVAKRRKPSPELARKLCAAEPRFTLAELRPDLWAYNSPNEASS
ncbi:hypothetical protein KMC49_gp03 [Ralstonia phage Firinga]|uniref:Uncharacterized protein n=2 Tax=Firingavirus firinga TaxID=2846043 RepID=A0A7G5B9U8_9CAUD|nr:hypothetical protein KMC49_gp03 [Ralstonia phage Firinga]QMV33071.1 hypothetical protein 18C_00003 [Ralstonia phage Firinga]QMV33335.1 hypothetical protein 12C_00025 [Ralstonia phage Hennie]